MAKIIGPASLNVDVTGYAPHLPVAGETARGTAIRVSPGGKGNNQLTAAHRAGAEVYAIGCRGEDAMGQVMARHFAAEGMSEKYVAVDPAVATASALIEIDETDGQNRILVALSANERVGRGEVLAAEADIATADAVLTQLETTAEAVLAAKELARKHGKLFILNPAPYAPLPEGLFEGIDLVTPNETEAEQFTGVAVHTAEDCRLAAEKFLAMGVRGVIITLGVRGVYFTDGARELLVPALPVKAVETTGAGDAFNGGLATALAEGMEMEVALRFATCTAALSVTRLGSSQSMPYRGEIEALMARAFGESV